MNYVIYGNGSAGNHGCEAIHRGTMALLGREHNYIIQSPGMEDDRRYGLGELASLWQAAAPPKRDLRFLSAYLKL